MSRALRKTNCRYQIQAQELIELSCSALLKISRSIDNKDDVYVNISTQVVQVALALVIKSANNYDGNGGRLWLMTPYEHAVFNLKKIKNSDVFSEITDETRKSFEDNFKILEQNYFNEASNEYNNNINRYSSQNRSNNGCYIATMVYKDYDHPQVMVLRNFRDNHLAEFSFGRAFIKFYYKYSPTWVLFLENKKIINDLIRNALNQLIRLIK
tara:strand:+ start:81 stop:716 length:636 start_codon:yes stop_codon:yes gene_type:complete